MRAGRRNGISGRQKQKNAAKPRAQSPARPYPAIAKLAVALREHREAVEQQAATAEILRALSRSSSDPQPVFEAIVGNAYRMTGAAISILYRYDGELLSVVAERHVSAAGARALRALYPAPPRRDHFVGRAVLEGRAMHSADAPNDPRFPGNKNVFAKAVPYRAALAVPLLKDGKVLGAIATERLEPKVFSKKEIDLLRTFADQAVIAMENVRLFNETKNALARQTATAEILRVLGSSVTDVQPVFDAIVKNCHDLFKDSGVVLRLVSDGQLHVKASVGYAAEPVPIQRTSAVGACVIDARTIHLPDLEEATKQFPRIRQLGPKYGYRSLIYAPLMRGGQAIGAIGVLRRNLGGFEDKDVQLLKTFADQAVIAIENVRLFNETEEALEHQKASADILRIVAGSVENTDPVFKAITAAGMRLIPGSRVALILVRDGKLHYASHSGVSEERRAALAKLFPMPLDKGFVAGATVIGKRTIHIPDFKSASARFKRSIEVSRVSGYRAMLSVPLIHGDKAIGVIAVSRESPGAFADKQIALVQTFADQAVIAVRNAQFFREIRDRNSELKQSLEFQGASAEILSSISSSIVDTKPVFDAIVRNVVRLCGTQYAAVLMVRGEQLELAAVTGSHRLSKEYAATFPQPVDRSTLTGEVLLSGRLMQLAPIIGNPQSSEQAVALARRFGYNAMILAPMIRDDKVIGVIGTARAEATGFDDKQVALLKAFADQAVIAIENVRLFNETKEALDQQTATAEILQVISSTPTDTQPVFDAIVRSAMRIFGGMDVSVGLADGEEIEIRASTLNPAQKGLPLRIPLNRDLAAGRAILDRSVLNIADIEALGMPPVTRERGRATGFRAIAAVPMLREGIAIGHIAVHRADPVPLSDKQIELLKTFAAQAVIAIENVRLFNETKEALEQQTATAEILRVISSSPTDIQPVFDSILEHALRLCDANLGTVGLYDGRNYQHVAQRGGSPEYVKWLFSGPFVPNPKYTLGRMIAERQPFHVPDYRELAAYREGNPRSVATVELGGARTYLAVPMLKEGKVIGGITIRRAEVRPFTQKQIDLVSTFANQAVIAIENVRLFNETKEALERQTATADILRVISGSPTSVQPVFEAILDNATRLCEAQLGALFLPDGDIWNMVSHRGASPEAQELYRNFRVGPHTGLGRMISERQPVHIEDLVADAATSERDPLRLATIEKLGARTFLAVPLLKDGAVIGAVVIYRKEVRPFGEPQIRLLSTFADQAVIAIENVRLFNETKEALEQQTAISEVLRVISDSPTDVKPVLDAVAVRAAKICEASDARIWLVEGDGIRHAAGFGDVPMPVELGDSLPLERGVVPGRAILDRAPVHVEDMAKLSRDDYPISREMQERSGFRTILAVPLMREQRALGAIMLRRNEVRSFTDKQIALLKTFADQAAIAIENVRLFNETKEALDQQTSTAEVLKTISRSTFDLGSVLQTLLDNATRLSGAHRAVMLRPDAAGNYLPAVTFNYSVDSPVIARLREHPIRSGRDSTSGRVLLERKPIHIADVLADPEYRRRELVDAGGYRTVLSVPMLRDGEAIGLITLTKGAEVDPFTEKQMEVVTTFADQAVIAIENVRLFKEIQEKGAQLEVANKHKSDFLANMSHELRTPLNAIIGFSEALMEKMFGELNDKQSDYLKDIHDSGRHLLSLINDILDLSKIEAGRMDLELSSFHLPTALSNAMTLIRERAQRHGIELGLEVDQRLGEFQADERKFKQIMLNLLSNAVKFTPDGGRVDVCAKMDTDKIEIAVKDTGIGIAPEDQAVVFEEFKQVGRDRMRQAEGTGLGLALTRRFVELHGGAIRLESTPGKGSTFTVSLPIRQ